MGADSTTDRMGGPDMAPHTPQRSDRPGAAGALLFHAPRPGGPDMAPHTPAFGVPPAQPGRSSIRAPLRPPELASHTPTPRSGSAAALHGELCFVERAEFAERGGLSRRLVVSDPGNARKAQREAGGIGRALLDLVVLDLDHHLGADAHRVAVVFRGEPPEPLGHRD